MIVGYLAALSAPRIILWWYLIWYFGVLVAYFDASPRLWLNSLGISGIVGVALYLSTARASETPTPLGRWQVFRFFLMPFCVSSFAALIKDRGFFLIFHPTWSGNQRAAAACAVFAGFVLLAKLGTASSARRLGLRA